MSINLESIKHLENIRVLENQIKCLGFTNTNSKSSLTFLDNLRFLDQIAKNTNILAAIIDNSISANTKSLEIEVIYSDNARFDFFQLHNSTVNDFYFNPSVIHKSAKISESASVAPLGVIIGANVIVEDFVVIHPGTEIKENSIIRGGAQIGAEALYLVRGKRPNVCLAAKHLGRTEILSEVEIGHNSVIDRALFPHEATTIGSRTKVACLTNISHGVMIGEENTIAAGVKICGYVKMGNSNWLGPSALVSNNIEIGSNCFIALGSRVLQNVKSHSKVIDHRIFTR